jgi:capsular polysaccharide biosynthesis protein
MVDLNNTQIAAAGYVPSSLISFMHLEDVVVAFMLGFVGSAGAFFFRYLQGKIGK